MPTGRAIIRCLLDVPSLDAYWTCHQQVYKKAAYPGQPSGRVHILFLSSACPSEDLESESEFSISIFHVFFHMPICEGGGWET